MSKYFGSLTDLDSVASCWGFYANDPRPDDFPTEDELIAAGYDSDGYHGSGTVVFEKGGKLYEVSSSHCSCDGMEWNPSEISWQYLENRIRDGYLWGLEGAGVEYLRNEAAKRSAVSVQTNKELSAAIDDLTDYSLLDPLAGLKEKPSA